MKTEKIILGKGIEYEPNDSINKNVIVAGGSGSGKTMSYIEPKLLNLKESNCIIKMSKRKLIDKYTPLLEERGYNVEVLNLVNPEQSTAFFDALHFVKSDSDVTYLAEALVNLDSRKKNAIFDPYWDQSAVLLLCAIIYMSLAIDDEPTLSKIIEYCQQMKIIDSGSSIETSLDYIFDSIEEDRPDHPCLAPWNSFRQLPPKTARCVYGTLLSSFNSVFSSEILNAMNCKNNINYEKIAQEKTVVFVLTSAVSPSLHSFSNLFFSYTIKELFEFAEQQQNGALPIPMELICDDFSVGGCILNFQDHISIFREKGISTSILIQSESQLESIYGQSNATTIINNADTYLYLGSMCYSTAQHIAQKVDLQISEVLFMEIGKEIIFRRGQKPILFAERYDVLNDKLYQKVTRRYEKDCGKESFNRKVNLSNQSINKKDKNVSKQSSKAPEADMEKLTQELSAKFDELFGEAS